MTSDSTESIDLTTKPIDRPDPDRDLIVLACKALRLLGQSGKAAEAGALAGKMWWATKETDPRGAERLNGVMHYLAKLEAEAGTPDGSGPQGDAEPELHAQSLDPSIRHATIIAAYEALEPGAGFVLVNSHDPKPLQYQFEAVYAGEYSWDYLETGPETWKIRVGRPTG